MSHLTSNDRINDSGHSPGIKQNKYGDDPIVTNQENSAQFLSASSLEQTIITPQN